MKKLAIGCGLALLIALVLGSVGAYYFIYRPAKAFVASMTQIGEVAELDAKVTNTRTFEPPADDALNEAQVRRFVAVQEGLHARMGARLSELKAKYEAIDARGGNVGVTEAVGAYRDLFSIIAEAKKAQVDGLNAQSFSVAEYTWVKTRFYEAAGVAVTGIDFREMASRAKNGEFDALRDMVKDASAAASAASSGQSAPTPAQTEPIQTDTPGVGIPEVNKTLVAPFKDKASTWMIYATLGL